jgi:hypothetical protein
MPKHKLDKNLVSPASSVGGVSTLHSPIVWSGDTSFSVVSRLSAASPSGASGALRCHRSPSFVERDNGYLHTEPSALGRPPTLTTWGQYKITRRRRVPSKNDRTYTQARTPAIATTTRATTSPLVTWQTKGRGRPRYVWRSLWDAARSAALPCSY